LSKEIHIGLVHTQDCNNVVHQIDKTYKQGSQGALTVALIIKETKALNIKWEI